MACIGFPFVGSVHLLRLSVDWNRLRKSRKADMPIHLRSLTVLGHHVGVLVRMTAWWKARITHEKLLQLISFARHALSCENSRPSPFSPPRQLGRLYRFGLPLTSPLFLTIPLFPSVPPYLCRGSLSERRVPTRRRKRSEEAAASTCQATTTSDRPWNVMDTGMSTESLLRFLHMAV